MTLLPIFADTQTCDLCRIRPLDPSCLLPGDLMTLEVCRSCYTFERFCGDHLDPNISEQARFESSMRTLGRKQNRVKRRAERSFV